MKEIENGNFENLKILSIESYPFKDLYHLNIKGTNLEKLKKDSNTSSTSTDNSKFEKEVKDLKIQVLENSKQIQQNNTTCKTNSNSINRLAASLSNLKKLVDDQIELSKNMQLVIAQFNTPIGE
eukprot:gene8912-860_t